MYGKICSKQVDELVLVIFKHKFWEEVSISTVLSEIKPVLKG
jgi:hypothetical protein